MITRRKFGQLVGGVVMTSGAMTTTLNQAFSQTPSSLERVKASGKLRIGAIADGVPYYQKSLIDGSWKGFYIDICKALAADLGVELVITETTWGNSVLDLQTDKIDVFFGLNPTPQRLKMIDMSGPVFKNAFTFIAKDSVTAKTWDEFNSPSMSISVDAGSSHDSAVTRHAPLAKIARLKSASDATAALQAGRVEAQCLVLVLALALRAKNPNIGQLIIPSPTDFTTSNAGFRREEDKSWMQFVDNWISQRRESGFIKDVIIKNMSLVGVKETDFPEGTAI